MDNLNKNCWGGVIPKVVNILWTGGWDSTFRIVELSRMDVSIQPVYVIDPDRKSQEYEKRAMKRIVEALKLRSETKAIFLPIKFYKLEDIPADKEISNAYKFIYTETKLGSQHEWLAWLGKLYPGMEMGTEAGSPETSHIIHALETFCTMDIKDGIGYINQEKSTKEGNLVFGWFTFPIITRTENDMLRLIKLWGYEDVMKLIWFCHNPIKGEPCGLCHPCDVKMESDMAWLLPKNAQKNYKKHKKIEARYGKWVANKWVRLQRLLKK